MRRAEWNFLNSIFILYVTSAKPNPYIIINHSVKVKAANSKSLYLIFSCLVLGPWAGEENKYHSIIQIPCHSSARAATALIYDFCSVTYVVGSAFLRMLFYECKDTEMWY